MKCRICGHENAAEAVKCKQCNALLKRPEAAPKSAAAEAAPANRMPLLLGAAGLAVILLGAVAYFVLQRDAGEPASQAAAAAPSTVSLEEQIGADVRRMEQAQQAELAEVVLDGLYAPASFATREAMMQYSFAVKELEDRRAGHDRQWQSWRTEVLQRIQQSSKTADEKAALVKKVEVALSASEAQRAKARAATKQWAHITLDLYDYAGSNAEHIDARGEEVRFTHPEVATGFRGRLSRAQRLQQEADKLSVQAAQVRHSKLKEAGIAVAE